MSKIFLSVPVLDRPELNFMFTMYQAILSCQQHQVRVYYNSNDSLISRVRNVHMSVFLNDFPECDYFMSLDSDLEIVNSYPNNNIFTKLISHDKDFVGGLYAIKKPGVRRSSSIAIDGSSLEFDSGLKEMRWLSSGCWCIKRSAVEKMVNAYPELTYDGDDNASGKKVYGLYIPMLYDLKPDDFQNIKLPFRKYLSEDWSFPVDPDTDVLCDNFVWKKIKNIDVGETVIGFDENQINDNQKRQMSKAKVVRKITKNLPKIKIITENGEIITTAEHQWLIKRGSRFTVTGRPKGVKNGHKTTNPSKSYWERTDKLAVGDYLYRPVDHVKNFNILDQGYIEGYINGVWDGDGNIYKSKKWNSTNITLRLCDKEIVDRVVEYFDLLGIKFTLKGPYKANSNPLHQKQYCIYVRGESVSLFMSHYNGKKNISGEKSNEFCAGYMSGIFDAEGHYDGATIDISQYVAVNPIVYKKIKNYSKQLGYSFTHTDSKRLRLTGIHNVHRFFIEMQPSVSRKMHLNGQSKGKDRLILPQRKEKIIGILDMKETGEMICLVTESSTFIANGFASHNCERWKAIGGQIYADTSIALKHIGKHDYNLFDVEVIKGQKPSIPAPGFDLPKK